MCRAGGAGEQQQESFVAVVASSERLAVDAVSMELSEEDSRRCLRSGLRGDVSLLSRLECRSIGKSDQSNLASCASCEQDKAIITGEDDMSNAKTESCRNSWLGGGASMVCGARRFCVDVFFSLMVKR